MDDKVVDVQKIDKDEKQIDELPCAKCGGVFPMGDVSPLVTFHLVCTGLYICDACDARLEALSG